VLPEENSSEAFSPATDPGGLHDLHVVFINPRGQGALINLD